MRRVEGILTKVKSIQEIICMKVFISLVALLYFLYTYIAVSFY